MSWPQVSLASEVDILSGFAFKSALFADQGDIPVIRIRDVDTGESNTYFTGEYDPQFVVQNDEMLISMDGEFRIRKWKGGPALLNQRVCKISSSSDRLDPNYLYWFLPNALKRIEDQTPFVTVKHLSVKKIKETTIPLPPIEEQRRIAAILDKADAVCKKRQQSLNMLDDLLRATFLDMFGDPVTNPKGWPEIPFEESLIIPLRNGISPSRTGEIYAKVLTLSAITGSAFDPSKLKTSTFETEHAPSDLVSNKDFLICRGNGNRNLVGKGYFGSDELDEVAFPDTVIAAQPDRSVLRADFLEALWSTAFIRDQIIASARTTNGTYKINQTAVKNIKVLVPPTMVQKEYDRIAASIKLQKLSISKALQAANDLFASLSQRAFKGEL